MDRIYHSWEKWEDHEAGFYNNISGSNREELEEKVFELFEDEKKCREMMYRVVNEWRNSSEHNLSNNGMNKVAYLGQAACCLFAGVPSTVTMSCWRHINKSYRDRADEIAKEVLSFWESMYAEV